MDFEAESVCRVALGLVFIGAAGIGIPQRRRADRVGGRVSARGDPRWFWIPMLVAAPTVAATCVGFMMNPRSVDFCRWDAPDWLRLLGVPIAALGLLLFRTMFRHLGLNVTSTSIPRQDASLVSTGPYRWVRHPMYSAALILVIAASLLTANLIVLIGGAVMFGLLALRSRIEEQLLVDKFGDDYREYQRRTGRFLPRIF